MPHPYEDELLSCTLLRTARRARLKPRAAANFVLGRPTACHSQFPRQLPRLIANMMLPAGAWERILREHTCYPLSEPFLDEAQRHRLRCWMHDDSAGMGRPGAKLFKGIHFKTYRFCPKCFEEQLSRCGEVYWRRIWQIPECRLCPEHGVPLKETKEPFRDKYGISRAVPASLAVAEDATELRPTKHEEAIAEALRNLLQRRGCVPSKTQLKAVYTDLTKGILRKKIDAAAWCYWGEEWLETHQISSVLALLRGEHWQAWWMHLTLIKALDPTMTLASVLTYASLKKSN